MPVERSGVILQICPNDHPPFKDLCRVYASAGERLGLQVVTVYLRGYDPEPDPDAHYLTDSTRAWLTLRQLVQDLGVDPQLAICHRYRAYKVFVRSRIRAEKAVCVAHEFGFFKRFQRRLERRLFAGAMVFAGVSPAVQAELAADVTHPVCLPNALDLERLAARQLNRDEALAELGLQPGPFTIGLLGRLVPKKQPALAIEALRKLATALSDDTGVRLLVIGDGELRARLEESSRNLPVRFCGFVADAPRLIKALDVLLVVSENVEAFGMVALEAMASGVPVVSGPAPGPQFVLGGAGLYYPEHEPESVSDALLRAYREQKSGQLVDRLKKGVARAEREFSVAAVARRLDDTFFSSITEDS